MKNVTLEEMLNSVIQDILSGHTLCVPVYYYENGSGEYHEIIELDLFCGRFVTDDGDFSEFEWELHESNIYIDEGGESNVSR